MKNFMLVSLLLMGTISVIKAQEKAAFEIRGKLTGLSDSQTGKLFLQRYDADLTLDSVQPKHGSFYFKGTTDGPEIANLFYIDTQGNRSKTLDFYLHKGEFVINGQVARLNKAHIVGSALNSDARSFDTAHKAIIDSINVLTSAYFKAEESLSQDSFRMDSPARAAINKIDVNLSKWSDLLNRANADYVDKNPDNALSLFKLRQLLKDTANQQLVSALYQKLTAKIKNTPLGQQVENQLINLQNLRIGDMAPEFALTDTTGRQIKLSDFRGKYVLVDFWASWCVPCRVENQHVQKTYDAFKDKGFEVLGISTDFNLLSWKKAVADDGMTWTNVSDPDGKISEQYHIKNLPSNFLLDPSGNIIGVNLRGESLYEKLKSTFNIL